MDKYQNKYRIPTARASWWDYGWNGAYFVTICIKNHQLFFGNILDGVMNLSADGEIAFSRWTEIQNRFPCAKLGPFVVMPNHIHGIIIIENPADQTNKSGVETRFPVQTRLIASVQPTTGFVQQTANSAQPSGGFAGDKNPMVHNNISRIIRWYKGRCSFETRKINPIFDWQSRFHDHIIRDNEEYQKISRYISNNPANWADDELFNEPNRRVLL